MFRNDYSELCADQVLQSLAECNSKQNVGYGLDDYSKRAEKLILDYFGVTGGEVHFLAGGTQANATVISYYLRPYEAVIACDTGHINVHETGAVEGTGHKVLTCPNVDGKLTVQAIEQIVKLHGDEHVVKPKMVYISDTTETGTCYSANELKEIRKVCDKHNLLLFLDGARLGVALTAPCNDVTAKLIGKLCDVFYVGGTKNGAMLGEAVVLKTKAEDFRNHIKNRGAMLAKGYCVGAQFERLFTDGLYFNLARHSNDMAIVIRNGLLEANVTLVGTSQTNQIFVRVNAKLADKLMKRYGVELWTDYGTEKVVRIVTSFRSAVEDCLELIEYVKNNM